MKLAERLALIGAGYKRKEIEALEKEELEKKDEPEQKEPNPEHEQKELPNYEQKYNEVLDELKITKEKLEALQKENRESGVYDVRTPASISEDVKKALGVR